MERLHIDKEEKEDYGNLIVMFLLALSYENKEKWDDFKNKLTYENRVFLNHKIIDKIDEYNGRIDKIIKSSEIFYRARIYKEYEKDINKDAKECLEQVIKEQIDDKKIVNEKIEECLKKFQFIYFQRSLSFPNLVDLKEIEDELRNENIECYNYLKKAQNLLELSKFKGFNKKESTAPPKDFVVAGRLNPSFIRYLYVAEEEETAIYEVKPKLQQRISIARCHPKKELKIFDFSSVSYDEDQLLGIISEKFSEPCHSEEKDYIPTQYLAEKIKLMGYDGIMFKSSLKKDGNNLVVFEPDNFEFISSEIKIIESIELKIGKNNELKII